jgi:hypothetical protein
MVRSTAWGAFVSLSVLLAVASPMLGDPPRDGFPLSTYPMFSRAKSRQAVVHHVVAFSARKRHRVVPPELLGNDEIMQAAMTVARAVRTGRTRELCEEVAREVAVAPAQADAQYLEVRTDTFDSVLYLQGERRPTRTRVHVRCEVTRP